MSDVTAIVAIITFCVTGAIQNNNKCEDGTNPQKYQMSILKGEAQQGGCENTSSGINCMPKYKTLDSIIEVSENDELIFRLKPDGKTEASSSYNPDAVAKAFWFAIFKAYTPTADIWRKQ